MNEPTRHGNRGGSSAPDRLYWIATLVLLLGGLCHAAVNEIVLNGLNCAVSVPPGWDDIIVKEPIRVCYRSPDSSKSVILEVIEAGDNRVEVDEGFIARRKQIESATGSKLISERRFSFCGFPAYETRSLLRYQGTNVSSLQRFVIAGGRVYKLGAFFINGDAQSDKTIQTYLDSFRFLTPPLSAEEARARQDSWTTFGTATGTIALVALTAATVLAYMRQMRKLRNRKLSEI